MAKSPDTVAAFFARYPPNVSGLAASLRVLVRRTIPDALETLDESGRVVGYAVGPGYAGLVCTIIPSKTGVKLGVVRGAALPDPHGLLEGKGRKHRYVQIDESADLRRPGMEDLIKAAVNAARPNARED
jgi:hypothetical protein